MSVSYSAPLNRAWARGKRILFPFRSDVWFTMGFAAFLSELLSGGHSSGNWNGRDLARMGGRHGSDSWPSSSDEILQKVSEVLHDPFWVSIIFGIFLVILLLAVVITWIGARGRFVFLDNVAFERPAIKEPWKKYARLGNSLFLWLTVFALLWVAMAVLFVIPFIPMIMALYHGEGLQIPGIATVVLACLLALPVGIVMAYISMMLYHFIVPIMWRHDLTTSEAWRRFLPLLRQNVGKFVLYGLFLFVLWMGITALILMFGLITCCVGFILLILPYIGSVALLPVLVPMRAYGPYFLAQFGPEWEIFPPEAPPAARPAPTPSGSGPVGTSGGPVVPPPSAGPTTSSTWTPGV